MEEVVLNIFLEVRERFDEVKDKTSLLKTYLEFHISSPGMAKRLAEFEGVLGFQPELLYRSKETAYGISVIYTLDDDVTKGIVAHEFAEIVAMEKDIHDHEAIDKICFERGFGRELLIALEMVLPGRTERHFIDLGDLSGRITALRTRIEKHDS
ncbi:MAG: hypothetical protein JSV60_07925 [Desulfobacterales bacterium]|jgi:hypothetical protein|nr:MAG: hypothetical protein JSV60_07925 [Desulfobacterales bacterium]